MDTVLDHFGPVEKLYCTKTSGGGGVKTRVIGDNKDSCWMTDYYKLCRQSNISSMIMPAIYPQGIWCKWGRIPETCLTC